MNDVVFADRLSLFEKQGAQKFNRCLKIIIPEHDGSVSSGRDGENARNFSRGKYVVIPPNAQFTLRGTDGGETVICIDQPLIPYAVPIGVARNSHRDGMSYAAEQAVYYFRPENLNAAVLSALGQLIVGYVSESFPFPLHPVVQSLKADIDANFADSTYSADTAINKMPLNKDYVRKIFKKETGVTPHEYLTQARMRRAEAIILSGVTNRYSYYTVSQIAEACGYAEPLYFSRVFKKYYGVSPLQYAKDNERKE